jgi:hypothetical protein
MTMDITADMALIRARFLAQFDTVGTQTLFENAPAKVIDETRPVVRFSVTPLNTEQLELGTGSKIRCTGIITLQVFLPDASGQKSAFEIGKPFCNAFRLWRSADGSVQCQTEYFREVPRKAGEPYQVNFNVPYFSER